MGKRKRRSWTHSEYVRVLHYLRPEFKKVLATFRSRWLVPGEVDDDPILNPYRAEVPELFESILLPEEIEKLEAVPFFTQAHRVVVIYGNKFDMTVFDRKEEGLCYKSLLEAVTRPLVGSPLVRGHYSQPEINDESPGDRDRFNSLVTRVDRLHRNVVGWLEGRKARYAEKASEREAVRRMFPAFPLPDKSAAMPDLGEVTERWRSMDRPPGQDFWHDPGRRSGQLPWERLESRSRPRADPGRMIEVLRRWLRYERNGVADPGATTSVEMKEGSTSKDYDRVRQWKRRALKDLDTLAPVVQPFRPAT
jgi:hypothetical protein